MTLDPEIEREDILNRYIREPKPFKKMIKADYDQWVDIKVIPVTVIKHNGQLGKASSSNLSSSFYYNVLLALIRDTVGSSSLAPEGLYKVL